MQQGYQQVQSKRESSLKIEVGWTSLNHGNMGSLRNQIRFFVLTESQKSNLNSQNASVGKMPPDEKLSRPRKMPLDANSRPPYSPISLPLFAKIKVMALG